MSQLPETSEADHRNRMNDTIVVTVSVMFALAALMSLVTQVSGTPYVPGGDTPAGTDCSGLASWVANVASGRPAFGDRFHTGNIESALLARGFHYGTAPNSLVIGWNSGHTAVTLPDGTPVSSGEDGAGVRVGGGGAFQPQFTRHMYLPVEAQQVIDPAAQPVVDPALPGPTLPDGPPPAPLEAPAPAPVPVPLEAPAPVPLEAPAPVPSPGAEPLPVEVDHTGAGSAPGGEPPVAAI